MDKSKINELNSVSENLGIFNRVKFYSREVAGVVLSVAPYSRVAVLYSKASFSERGKIFTATLKRAGIKPLNFIMPDDATLNLENVFDVIGVPDDVRAVVCFDRELINVSAYIATLFKIPVVLNLNSVNADGALPVKVPFFLGTERKKADLFTTDCPFYVAVSVDNAHFSAEDISEQYVSIISKQIALADYRVKRKIFGGKAYKAACDLIKSAINGISSSPLTAENAVFYGLMVEIANVASDGEIIYNSAEYSFKRILGYKGAAGLGFAVYKRLTGLYALCAERQEVPFALSDYNERVSSLATLTGTDDGEFLKGFLRQKQGFIGEVATELKKSLLKEFTALNNALNKTEEKYLASGGKTLSDFTPFIPALKHCGDMPDTFNFMTIARESGFTEF